MDLQGKKHLVAVVGAGPAGLFGARTLAESGAEVVLFNRDIKPGGLAEYGIYPDKFKMKDGLRRQFKRIMAMPNVHYYGNVTIGQEGDLTLAQLRQMGFQAVLVTVGAQGTKWLGLPGEELAGVYHAKDLVYHYNKLPPFSEQAFPIGRRVAVIGVGNVMLDIAHWTVRDLKVDEVIGVARRGPAEVKFTKKEMEIVAANLDVEALKAEIQRCAPTMEAVGQDVAAAYEYIVAALPRAEERLSDTRLAFRFLSSPRRILGDEAGRVCGLEVEDTTLVPTDGQLKARGLGTTYVLPVETVVFAIGDRVDPKLGLPVAWNEYVKAPDPRFPIAGISYEAYDPEKQAAIEGVFVAGWARQASEGLVGVARKDGTQGAQAVLLYLESAGKADLSALARIDQTVQNLAHSVVCNDDVARLEEVEAAEAEKRGLEEFKFASNEEMLAAISL